MKQNINTEFSPGLFHPYYFIRNGLRKEIESVAHHLSGKIMDFGCGSKPYQSLFNASEYVGVDYENEGHPHDNEHIDVFYDGKEIPFANDTFDSIICSEVFEHIFNLDEILIELNRVLKLNGTMLVTCPFVWNEHEVPHDYARYTQFALTDLLKKAGFEIVIFRKSGNFILTIHQLYSLYFFRRFKGIWRKIFFLRWIYKIFFFFLPNMSGLIWNGLFVKDYSLYLNNVVVVRKIQDVR